MNLPLNTPFINASATDQARFNMIEQQIRPWDVLDNDILDLLAVMRREDFVPPEFRTLAFADMEIPLPGGQTMLAPRVEARMLQDLQVRPQDVVLEIGTGSGYMAALLSQCAAQVITLEIDADLAEVARANLRHAGISNVEVRVADGSAGTIAGGPFDVIALSGSVAEVPAGLLAQLKAAGRLAAIVGEEPMMRATFVRRVSAAGATPQFDTVQPWDTTAPRLAHFPEFSRFHF